MGGDLNKPNSNIVYNNPDSYIRVALNKETYFPGDEISGEVWIEPVMDLCFTRIIVSLIVNENWKFTKEDNTYTDSNEICLYQQNILENKVYMNNQMYQSALVMNANTKYQFPFSFILNKELIPTFEHWLNDITAYARYRITASLIGSVVYPQAFTAIVIKSNPKILQEPLNFSSCKDVYTWGVFNYGTTILSVSYPTNNYKYNDDIELAVTVNNTRGLLGVYSIELSLMRHITLKSHNIIKHTQSKEINSVSYPYKCPMSKKLTYSLTITLTDKDKKLFDDINDQVYPVIGNNKGVLVSDINSLLIECKYSLEVRLLFESFVGEASQPKVTLPLSVTYQTVNEVVKDRSVVEKEDEELKKVLYESKIEFENKELIEEEIALAQLHSIVNENKMIDALYQKDNSNVVNEYPLSNSQHFAPYGNNNQQQEQNKEETKTTSGFIDINAL